MELKNINIHERMKHYNIPGLSIALINNGILDLQESFGVLEAGTNNKVNSDSIFNACSISKFATAMLVLKLTEQGILDLDENVNERLISWKVPENVCTQYKKVTLRTLLSHQSGVIDPEGSFCEYDSIQGNPTMLDLLEGRKSYCPEPIEVKYEPESDFQYSDAGFCIIEQLIEDISGKPFKLLMDELIFEPLNMKNSKLEYSIPEVKRNNFACGHNKDGKLLGEKYPIYPYPAAAGLRTTPTDLAILVIELINSLKGSGKLGLSESMIKEMLTPQGCSKWTGLGIFLDKSGQELEISSLGWGVGYQCMMIAFPYLETGAVIMTNSDLGIHQTKGIIGEIVKSLVPQLN
ncbi:serine hydrolase domain-containing protein [Bacillus sp. DX1.1]|uniref:serine hydrolase domain-containing protein n=1 Tax=unclassified Bacillus (in: firmicutes) TaxID=185979 RepID=UPI002570F7C2|nr:MULTISPECIES: serine hydrolase domain-containing protein [unclassified Bacillus (in: firmicutes)]MDM5155217.1 serine hydrolase domain-containing protein [Bacillus sp. DX1.1]WJE79537.1 serine hydrolase domain-containing protein [Bacillus sp. DX3.1]